MKTGIFKAGDKSFPLTRTYVMGILNVTPDSFSDGGKYLSPEAALLWGEEMERDGADIIDIGAQSTRPGYAPVPWEEEWERLEPVLAPLIKRTSLAVSVDTFYPQVAVRALALGAHIINDVKGFGGDMMKAVRGSECGCVIMCPNGGEDIISEEKSFFKEKTELALAHGISLSRICLDPGIGFGNTREQDIELIARIGELRTEGTALLIGASRKRVISFASGECPPEERLWGTIAAHTAGVLGGADIVRAHDVKEAVQAARTADAVKEYF